MFVVVIVCRKEPLAFEGFLSVFIFLRGCAAALYNHIDGNSSFPD